MISRRRISLCLLKNCRTGRQEGGALPDIFSRRQQASSLQLHRVSTEAVPSGCLEKPPAFRYLRSDWLSHRNQFRARSGQPAETQFSVFRAGQDIKYFFFVKTKYKHGDVSSLKYSLDIRLSDQETSFISS